MRLHIAGMGWVTPLGSGIEAVWERLLRGEEASANAIAGPFENKTYCAFRVPPALVCRHTRAFVGPTPFRDSR